MNPRFNEYFVALALATAEKMLKQISFPSFLRALIEIAMFCGVFLAAGYISLGVGLMELAQPMIPVVFVIMLSSIMSGVYRRDITNSIMNIYVHSAYGFLFASMGSLAVLAIFYPQYSSSKFIFFFLFFAFFVSNTVRPLISGTDFMDGGGRRTN